ncbi:AMP-binding protein [Rhodococcus sp. GXMU-t2271]
MSTIEIKARIDAMVADDHTRADRTSAATRRRPGWASSRRGTGS